MTTHASIMQALVKDAISKELTPEIIGDFPIENYYKLYDFHNCLFVLGIDANLHMPYDSDYMVYIISYEKLYSLITNSNDAPLVPANPSTLGVSEVEIRNYLVELEAKNYYKYSLYLDGNNYFKDIKAHDYSNSNMFKILVDMPYTHLIPPVVNREYIYSTYFSIDMLMIPLRDISTNIAAANLPTEIKTLSDECKAGSFTINQFVN